MFWPPGFSGCQLPVKFRGNLQGIRVYNDNRIELRAIFIDFIDALQISFNDIGNGKPARCVTLLELGYGYFFQVELRRPAAC